MTEASGTANTPASAGSAGTPAKTGAAKDRACPYCHVNFTSSSLGRHLDLYIREKNAKAPDGIHNVEEIKRSRGQITRRQARSSVGRRQQNGQRGQLNGHTSEGVSPVTTQDGGKLPMFYRHLFNTPHWTSTGVITDSDANTNLMHRGGEGLDALDEPSGSQSEMSYRRQLLDDCERGRAAELALNELVDSIKAASTGWQRPPPFDFEFWGQSFPSLCLRLLPAPPTVNMPSLIPSPDSWPLDLPGEATYEALKRKIIAHLTNWRCVYYPPKTRKRPRESESDLNSPPMPSTDPSTLEPIPLYLAHLSSAFSTWQSQPAATRLHEWHLEGLRAHARELEAHAATKSRLEALEIELARAKIDNARLTECQMPREWLHSPAAQLPMAKLAAEKVEREYEKEGRLDAETMIERWRPRVRAARGLGRGKNQRSPAQEEDGAIEVNGQGRLLTVRPAGGTGTEQQEHRRQRRRTDDGSNQRMQIVDMDDDDDGDEEGEDDGDAEGEGFEDEHEQVNGTLDSHLSTQLGVYTNR